LTVTNSELLSAFKSLINEGDKVINKVLPESKTLNIICKFLLSGNVTDFWNTQEGTSARGLTSVDLK